MRMFSPLSRMASVIAAAGLFAILSSNPAAAQEGWVSYDAPAYGFEMKVPPKTKFVERELKGGWGVLQAELDGVKLFAVGKMGYEAKAKEIEKVGVKLTKIPAKRWKEIDKGKGNGWKWFSTVKATDKGKVVYGGYGTGPKGSYLLILTTTADDFKAHRKDYERWYKSVKLK